MMQENKEPRPPGMTTGQKLLRFAAIGVAVLGLGAAFGYTGGWLGPQRLTADRIANTFEPGGKRHPGFRRNHAKGICVTGHFASSGQAQALSSAPLFAPDTTTPLVGRLALPGPNPYAPDSSVPIRSFALRFTMPDGQQWRTGMNSMPVFPVSTPQSFYEQQLAGAPDPKTGKPDPAKLKAFFAAHPETATFLAWVKTARPSASFATEAYYGLNAFVFINDKGVRQNVRWRVVPIDAPVAADATPEHDQNYLDKDLMTRLSAGPLRWRLMVTVADSGDPSNDATKQWPDSRRQVEAGTIVIEKSQTQDHGPCRDINFDPTVLPQGMAISDDPLLPARSAVYATSVDRRTREGLSSPALSSSTHSSEHAQ
ncbi:putative catalase [Advenella mimigardefordensis DPN7]|uniref:Catalase-related peroxidase n=2 Tax=Advenella mimigardefordensis TaxID=302406 RepID=W0PAR6_ADVMD|nr:putative catalase [Advenella mimigardefordensis DPN7]